VKPPTRKYPRSQWTRDEVEFDRLIALCESPIQMIRIEGRLDMKKFTDKHGKEKCDQMWERIK
jgi:hypothetical protein